MLTIKRRQGGELFTTVNGEDFELGIKVGDNDAGAVSAAAETMVELAAYGAEVAAAKAALDAVKRPATVTPVQAQEPQVETPAPVQAPPATSPF